MLPPEKNDVLDLITRLVASTCFSTTARFYDLQLDHWGFSRKGTESFRDMHLRLKKPIGEWWESEHNGFKDNGTMGAAKLNDLAREPSAHTYYFTMSFDATKPYPKVNPSVEDVKRFPVYPLVSLHGFGFPGPFDVGAHIGSGLGHIIHAVSDVFLGSP